MKWKVAHACVRGSSHTRSGLPNQDAAQCSVSPGAAFGGVIAIAAVSDGHGGARHFRSQIGSSLAISTAVGTVQEFLQPFAAKSGAGSLDAAQVQMLQQKLADRWLASVASDLEQNPLTADELNRLEKEDGAESRSVVEASPQLAYGATLLVAAATESLLLYLQLGDGEILSVTSQGETARPLPSDDRLVGNQTTSLCQPEAWKDFRSAWVIEPALPALVLLSTDGYVNSFRSDEDFLRIGHDYLEILRAQGISLLADELPEILREATQQGSGDDITLAILQGEIWQNASDAAALDASVRAVRPAISPSSRSALIEQLKARHSSQRQKLEDLASRVEQAHRDNRRMRLLLLGLLLVAVAVALYFFRDRIPLLHADGNPVITPRDKPSKGHSDVKPESTPGGGENPPGAVASAAGKWMLTLSSGSTLTLQKAMLITDSQIHPDSVRPDAGDALYAEVAALKNGRLLLINRSAQGQGEDDAHANVRPGDVWTVKCAGRTEKVPPGKGLELVSDPAEIDFTHHVTGKVAPVPDTPAASVQAMRLDQ
jgi:serine/threonine protein phosphatase PrpC